MSNPSQAQVIDPRIVHITDVALQVSGSQRVIDRVTIVRGYAELSVMYPENSRYRDEMWQSLVKLSEVLESFGKRRVAMQARSVAAGSH